MQKTRIRRAQGAPDDCVGLMPSTADRIVARTVVLELARLEVEQATLEASLDARERVAAPNRTFVGRRCPTRLTNEAHEERLEVFADDLLAADGQGSVFRGVRSVRSVRNQSVWLVRELQPSEGGQHERVVDLASEHRPLEAGAI